MNLFEIWFIYLTNQNHSFIDIHVEPHRAVSYYGFCYIHSHHHFSIDNYIYVIHLFPTLQTPD